VPDRWVAADVAVGIASFLTVSWCCLSSDHVRPRNSSACGR
jgi:hypothetical protein